MNGLISKMRNPIEFDRFSSWTEEQIIARNRFFPGSWRYDDEILRELQSHERATYFVYYETNEELVLARSVAPRFANVEYHYVGLEMDKKSVISLIDKIVDNAYEITENIPTEIKEDTKEGREYLRKRLLNCFVKIYGIKL